MKASVVASMANSWRVQPLIVSTKYANTALVPHNGFAILDAHVHHGVVLCNRSLECRCTAGLASRTSKTLPPVLCSRAAAACAKAPIGTTSSTASSGSRPDEGGGHRKRVHDNDE